MGLLIDGVWHDKWYDTDRHKGDFVREPTRFRDWITPATGTADEVNFPAEAGRYHLYVSYACPWASRTLILRTLKGLEDIVSVSVVHPHMLEHGWEFKEDPVFPEATGDHINGFRRLHQVYTLSEPGYTGRVTVPVLFDKTRRKIVNNESADIIRMLNSAFDALTEERSDYYPTPLRRTIDEINEFTYTNVNNGVYRCGFATHQMAYERAFDRLFSTLDRLEDRLSAHRYLAGRTITEADWRLFVTLVRFDAVYYGHFKCNLRRVIDYPNLSHYMRDLYQHRTVANTVKIHHIKAHYYYSHPTINPTRIVPKGPELDFDAPHDRGRFD